MSPSLLSGFLTNAQSAVVAVTLSMVCREELRRQERAVELRVFKRESGTSGRTY
jgi:hypothetical protein